MKFTINVTQDDIDNGTQRDGRSCAVARAIKRRFKLSEGVQVGNSAFQIEGHKTAWLPDRAREFISSFDRNKTRVKPSRFTVDIVSS